MQDHRKRLHGLTTRGWRNLRERPVFSFQMLPFYSFTFIVLLVCASFFYRAGEFEGSSGIVWAAVSILISVAIWQGLPGGALTILLTQVGLFASITLYRSRKKP